jgi:hypothetical protein
MVNNNNLSNLSWTTNQAGSTNLVPKYTVVPSTPRPYQLEFANTEADCRIGGAKQPEIMRQARTVIAAATLATAGFLVTEPPLSGYVSYSVERSDSLVNFTDVQERTIFSHVTPPAAGSKVEEVAIREVNRYRDFNRDLTAMLMLEPIEDGVGHPAEQFVEAASSVHPEAFEWIQKSFIEAYSSKPTVAAAILRVLGRLCNDGPSVEIVTLAVPALKHVDVEVRDAAVMALEASGGPKAVTLLETHVRNETVPRLASYIKQVIRDLQQ